jgi:hypothetical protein
MAGDAHTIPAWSRICIGAIVAEDTSFYFVSAAPGAARMI